MKRIALAAAGAAVAGLTACSHTAASTAAAAGHKSAVVPASCSQRYHTWQDGQGKGLTAAMDAVSSAVTAGDPHVLRLALKQARPAVARAARHPMPGCADPMGYWSVLLMHVNAGVAGTGSPSSLQAAMKDVPKIQQKLTVELKRTTR